tara:strand:- start:905 stop:1153 length:249 start_codon:yes stop_codon:yes gene_type:complete
MKNKNFYGKFSTGAAFKNMQSNYYSKKNISYISKLIKKNLRKMEISKNDLKNKVIMNVVLLLSTRIIQYIFGKYTEILTKEY